MPAPKKPRGMEPTTSSDRIYSSDEQEFHNAVEAYKRRNKVRFPTLSELLLVLKSLGYEKKSPPDCEHTLTSPSL